jgi:hypothetical protein
VNGLLSSVLVDEAQDHGYDNHQKYGYCLFEPGEEIRYDSTCD